MNDFIREFSIQTQRQPSLILSKIGQGNPSNLIYKNAVEHESPILHAKFYYHRSFGSELVDFKSLQ